MKDWPRKPHESEECNCGACARWGEDYAIQRTPGYHGFMGVYKKLKYMKNPFFRPDTDDSGKPPA